MKRPRIKKNNYFPKNIDNLESDSFQENAGSKNAKKKNIVKESFDFEIWVDKHYENRVYHGSDDGSYRDGIEYNNIEPIIIKSIRHLLYYSLKSKIFIFLNYPPNKSRNTRIILKDLCKDKNIFLNVVLEYHFINLNTIEVTIITALKSNDFSFADGQFGIEFDDNYSKLIQYKKHVMYTIDEYEYED